MPEVKHSACELIRLKKSGLEADGGDNKQADDVKRHGPATWPGDDNFLLIYYLLSVIATIIINCWVFIAKSAVLIVHLTLTSFSTELNGVVVVK